MTFFGKNLRHIRESRGLDLKALGKLFGVPGKQVSYFEEGFSEPDLPVLVEICEKLEVSIDKMLRVDMALLQASLGEIDIKLLVLDVDGVMTDGGMFFSQNGDRLKKFNAKDGRAVRTLTNNGVEVGFLSGGDYDKIIRERAAILGVKFIKAGTETKLETLKEWQAQLSLSPEQIACVGDDVNDLPLIEYCGLSACPADAVNAIKEKAKIVLNLKGGEGCVREFVDQYLMASQ